MRQSTRHTAWKRSSVQKASQMTRTSSADEEAPVGRLDHHIVRHPDVRDTSATQRALRGLEARITDRHHDEPRIGASLA
jgi:hypothetical protein